MAPKNGGLIMVFKELSVVQNGSGFVRGNYITVDEFPKVINKHCKDETEVYISYYDFDEQLKKHLDETNSIVKYNGLYRLSKIILDIDKASNSDDELLKQVRNEINYIEHTLGLDADYIHPWFSGTGFHIDIPEIFGFKISKSMPMTVKKTLSHIFPNCDSIYDGQRLIRLGYTWNKKSGLYKTPLSIHEVMNMTMDEIKNLAKKPRLDFRRLPLKHEPFLQKHIIEANKRTKATYVITDGSDESSTGGSYTSMVTCVQKMWREGPIPTSQRTVLQAPRHEKILRIANAWRRQGVPRDAIYTALLGWNSGYTSAEIRQKVDSVFSWDHQGYGCNEDIMNLYCDAKCKYYSYKNFGIQLSDKEKDLDEALDYYLNLDESTCIDLNSIWNIGGKWLLAPGEVIIVTGDTGMGKTSFVNHLVWASKKKTIFFQLELDKMMAYRRFAQCAINKGKDEVFLPENRQKVKEELAHIHMECRDKTPHIDTLIEYFDTHDFDVMVIDSLDLIQGDDDKNDFQQQKHAITTIMDIAHNKHKIVIIIHHKNKKASVDGDNSAYSLTGIAKIPQYSDKILSVTGTQGEQERIITVGKARDADPSMMIVAEFDGESSMRFKQL
jgi:nucleoside-triphosphatase THEP1